MNINNLKYTCFKNMMDGYNTKTNEGHSKFISYTMGWLESEKENPFTPGSEEHSLFDRMMQHYVTSKKNVPGSKYSSKQIEQEASILCSMKIKNPYKYDKKAEAQDQAELKALEEEREKARKAFEQKAIEREAARIIKEEEEAKLKKIKEAEAKIAKNKELVEQAKKNEEMKTEIQKIVEAKRSESAILQKPIPTVPKTIETQTEAKLEDVEMETVHILGVLPDEPDHELEDNHELEDKPVETNKEHIGFFKRLFGRKKAKQ